MRIKEDAPTVNAGGGNIAGIGVGPQGEPGVSTKAQRRQSKNKSTPTSVILGMLRRKAPNPIAETVQNRGGSIAAPKRTTKITLKDRMDAFDKKPKSIRDIERGAFASLNVPPNLHPSKAKQEIERIRRKSSEATYGKDYPSDIKPVRSEESESDNAQYGSNVTINGKNMGRMNDPNNPNKSAIDAARQSVRNAFGKNDKSDSSSNRPGAEVQRYPDKNWEESYKLAEETFAGATVFEVNSNLFYNLTLAKRKGKHWRTYLEEDDCYAEIREWARNNKGPIAVKNKNTGEIRMVRYGR